MRWLAFAVCATAGLILQTTLAERLAVFQIKPDWMFVLAVFFGLYSTRRDAILAGWILGMLVDLASVERLGLMSIAFGLTAALVNSVRHVVFLKNAVTHFAVTFAAGLLLHAALAACQLGMYPQVARGWGPLVLERSVVCLYTGLWALPVHQLMLRFTRILGLATSPYAHAHLVPAEGRHV